MFRTSEVQSSEESQKMATLGKFWSWLIEKRNILEHCLLKSKQLGSMTR